jgi:hypothetical protein
MTARWALAVTFGLLPGLALAADVQPVASVRVEGALPKTGSFSQGELEKLGGATVPWTSRGQTHQVTGVRLDKLLVHLGFTPGAMGKDVLPKDKVKGYRQVLVATARDGFQAVFSCAELLEGMGPTAAYIVWLIDGKPLTPDVGPFRLVVVTDAEPARSLRMLERLRVTDAS